MKTQNYSTTLPSLLPSYYSLYLSLPYTENFYQLAVAAAMLCKARETGGSEVKW